MAKVLFLTGRAGSGKSARIRAAVGEAAAAGRRVFLIVPEQYTFESERELSEQLGSGLIGAGVYSFTSLARLVRRETGNRQVYLSKEGSRMAVRRVISESAGELQAFARVAESRGFAEKLVQLFAMFRGSGIEPSELAAAAEDMGDTLLGTKLRELALIYGRTREYLEGRYMDENDMIDALIAGLPDSSVKGADVFVDGFPKLNNQAFRVLETLLLTAASVTVAFTADDTPDCRDRAVFATDMAALRRLTEFAREAGIEPEFERTAGAEAAAPELRWLEGELYAPKPRPFDGEAAAVTVFAAADGRSEAEAAAEAVARAAREGVRYSEMAVIVTSDALLKPVARALARDGVPVFADIKTPLSGYPEARLILAALSAAADGFKPKDVLAVAKTGLAGVARDDTELLENYIIRYGIYGSSMTAPFTFGNVPEGAERARATLMEPLMELRTSMSRATAREKTEALFQYMERLGAAPAMAELSLRLRTAKELRLSDETAQVNNGIMELLDQLYVILGESQLSNKRFLEIVSEGLAAGGVGVIPTTADQLLLGTLSRTRARTVKALFLVGCNEGLLPLARQDQELIDDRELEELRAAGLPTWGGVAEELSADTLNIYTMFAKPTHRLWLGYALSSGDGEAQASSLIDRTLDALPRAVRETDVGGSRPPFTAEAALPRLAEELRDMVDTGVPAADTEELYGYFASAPAYRDRLDAVERALYHTGAHDPLGRDVAELLYGRGLKGSVSRLERFHACPFSHFASYGLALSPRREYREQAADEGAYFHTALERYLAAVDDFKTVTDDDCNRILDTILPALAEEHNDGILLSTPRMRAKLRVMDETVRQTAWAVTRQLAEGEFRPVSGEVRFGMGGDSLPPLRLTLPDGRAFEVRGVIDRVDEAVLSGQKWYRIIDYKRGGKRFDPTDAAAGLQIQLPIYIAALLAAERTAKAAGMFYMGMLTPNNIRKPADDPALIQKELLKQFRLSGLVVDNDSVVCAMSRRFEYGYSQLIQSLKETGGNARVSEDGMATVVDRATGLATDAFARIVAGEVTARPFRRKDNKTPCGYCDFRSMCAFDERFPACRYRDIRTVAIDKLTERGDGDGMD